MLPKEGKHPKLVQAGLREGRQVLHSKRVVIEKATYLPLVSRLRLDIEFDKLNSNSILFDSVLFFCEAGN
jgi:hypothetical protein